MGTGGCIVQLERFEYILAIIEEQSFTRAAKRLFISQPTLTQYVNKLEAELGVRLFHRSKSPVTLTEAGVYYLNSMRRIYVEEQRLYNQMQYFQETRKVFRIGMSTLRAKMWLPLILPEFSRNHPEVSIQCTHSGDSTLEEIVQQGKVDVALGALNRGYHGLSYACFPKETLHWILPRNCDFLNHAQLDNNSPQNPLLIPAGILEQIPLLLPEPEYGFYQSAQTMLEKHGIAKIFPAVICSNPETNYQMAAAGMGATLTNGIVLDTLYPNLREKVIFATLTNPPATRIGRVAWRPDTVNDALVQDFVQTAVNALEQAYPNGT